MSTAKTGGRAKVISWKTFISENTKYYKSPLLNLDHHGYCEINSDALYKIDLKPKLWAEEMANRYPRYKSFVYRVTAHTFGERYVYLYGKC